MNNPYRVLSKLQNRQFTIGRVWDTFCIGTPWFILQFADNFGSIEYDYAHVWGGFKVFWRWNEHKDTGGLIWLKEKAFYTFRISFKEIEENAYIRSLQRSK